MLRVGLTGGIGSGKSTVAQRFRELGAVVIDADQLAREVVAVGSTGLAAIHERFGDAVFAADGSLDRGALGALVFADAGARRDLEAITHPLIDARRRLLVQSAAPGQIVVQDVPLLVEKDMSADYHLTVVVGAEEDLRVTRLMSGRGLTEAAVRARIAAQASDFQRRSAADAWLDNNGTVAGLLAQVDALWQHRIVGFNENLMNGSRGRQPQTPALAAYDDSWPSAAVRLMQRITLALGGVATPRVVAIEHIGSTSVPDLVAQDVIDLQLAVPRLSDADAPEFVKALADKGFPRLVADTEDGGGSGAPGTSLPERMHGSSDPGRVVHLHIGEHGSAGWESALLFRDWLVANPAERDDYADLKRTLARSQRTTIGYTLAKETWIAQALERARVWARHTGWSAP
jgi:dephospho-CoA kinase